MDFQMFVEKQERIRRPWLFVQKSKGGFDPDQPRDEIGRWAETGAKRAEAKRSSVAQAIETLVPESNLVLWDVPEGGLPDAESEAGDWVDTLAYNPKTRTLVFGGGGQSHADLIADYAAAEKYDDFVKIIYDDSRPLLEIDTSRTKARSAAEGWELGFDAAKAMIEAGFAKDLAVSLTLPKRQFVPGKEVELELGEMV